MKHLPLRFSTTAVLVLVQVTAVPPAVAEEEQAHQPARLSADEMLALSDRMLAHGDTATATQILESLLSDPKLHIRNEARFRLAMLAVARNEHRRAALLLRAILDEEPDAQRVRLELARVLGLMGDVAGARRELRQAQAGGLPSEVARMVDRFSAALREHKPFGGHIEVALAPDSNINRATQSDTLDTVIGKFELGEDAKPRSGVGLALRGTGYFRRPLGRGARLLAQLSFDGNFYREGAFSEIAPRLSIGPEFQLRKGRLRILASHQRRWFGGDEFSDTSGINAQWERPLDPTAQLRLSGEVARTDVAPNSLQDATTLSFSGSFEKALSQRAGLSLSLSGARQHARDPGYSNVFGQAALFGWREAGRMTLIAGANYSRLVADERLILLPRRRADSLVRLTAGATLRQFTVAGFAPQLRLTWERNASTVEIYDYSRLRSELGIVRAF